MAATYCYKKGQGLLPNWKLRYIEFDAVTKMLTYRTHDGGHKMGEFKVGGVNENHADTAGHEMVFEIIRADGRPPLLCAGLIAGMEPSHRDSFPHAKSKLVRAIKASFQSSGMQHDIEAESRRMRTLQKYNTRTFEAMRYAARHFFRAWELGDEEAFHSFAADGLRMTITRRK